MTLFSSIPGETPIDDISGLKIKGITLRRELNKAEADNILKAVTKYFVGKLTKKDAPFDYWWSLQLHKEMFGDVWAWAGSRRQYDTNLGVARQHIEFKLADLFLRLPYWKSETWPKQAAMLHHEAVSIHPFPNGNGRWSRLLANIWLRLHDQPYPLWPEAAVGEVSTIRQGYLAAIQSADKGDYAPLLALQEQYTPKG